MIDFDTNWWSNTCQAECSNILKIKKLTKELNEIKNKNKSLNNKLNSINKNTKNQN